MEAARLETRSSAPFLLTREYKMFKGDESNPASEVKAQIEVVPQRAREYKIIESHGSDRGEGVVRKILDHESQSERMNPPPSAITRDNYDFQFVGEERFQNALCYVLQLKAKRKDPTLVNGRVWVDANSFHLRKVEGEMAKSPSWWVKNVKLTLLFGEMAGIWMQTTTQATAEVRLIGRYTVDGKTTDVKTATAVAQNRSPQKRNSDRARRVDLLPGVMVAR